MKFLDIVIILVVAALIVLAWHTAAKKGGCSCGSGSDCCGDCTGCAAKCCGVKSAAEERKKPTGEE